MASRKKASDKKTGNAGKGKQVAKKRRTASIATFLKREEREVTQKFHGFLDAWKSHIHEEIAIHKKFAGGKRNLKQHVADTVKIHEKFLKNLGKI